MTDKTMPAMSLEMGICKDLLLMDMGLTEEGETLGECRPAGGSSVLFRVGAFAHVPLCQGQ